LAALSCASCTDGSPFISNPDGSTPGEDGGGHGADGATEDGGGEGGAVLEDATTADGDADGPDPDAPIVGVAFQPLTIRREDGQTLPLQGITGLAFMPDGSGLLVWEKAGRLIELGFDGDTLVQQGTTQLADVYWNDDCGLTTLAFDPEWETNHYVFAAHCADMRSSVVVRYVLDGEDYDSVPQSASLVLELGDPAASRAWHNIGSLGFFDDEHDSMWLLVGEKSVDENAQDLSSDLGKVLRIIPRREQGMTGYEPHPDNPFAGDPETTSGPNLYAWGLRSPWRGTVDRNGRVFIGEVGEKAEEINVVRQAEQNFGWSEVDGPCADRDDCDTFTDPTVYWHRSSNHRYRVDDEDAKPGTARVAWVGAYYEGERRDRYKDFLDDTVLFSDMCLGFVRALEADGAGVAVRDEHVGHLVGLTGSTAGPDGYLYVASFGGCTSSTRGVGGGIFRVVPRTAEEPTVIEPTPTGKPLADEPLGPMPLRLSETELFEDDALREPIARAVRYAPTLQLWSNGSEKDRFMLLPEGEQVDNGDRQTWDFPPGTLFVKTFSFTDEAGDTRRIETRIIRRTETGYDYHGYKWNPADDEADILSLQTSTSVTVKLGEDKTITHRIPSAFDCRSCHESNATVIIGFDELRLNGPGAGEPDSQLEAFAADGVFVDALPEQPAQVTHDDARTAEVLGYLHGNCAHCHNRSPNTQSALSLEHSVALESTINMPTEASGQAPGIRIVPGSPDMSILFKAFARETTAGNFEYMPPVGVQKVDTDAVQLIEDWIRDLPVP
jgi:glucose/arabinose dehydrogenase